MHVMVKDPGGREALCRSPKQGGIRASRGVYAEKIVLIRRRLRDCLKRRQEAQKPYFARG
jgi:hypothetical protein